MFIENPRFNLNTYLRKSTKTGARERTKPKSRPIANTAFKRIVLKAKGSIQKTLNKSIFRKKLKNRSLTHIFLSKVRNTAGQWSSSQKYISKHSWGSATWGSMEMMRYLSSIIEDKRLDEKTKHLIDEWIEQEKDYLPIAIIIDSIRSMDHKLENFFSSPQKELLGKPFMINFDEKDISTISMAIVEHLNYLPKMHSFKMLGGHQLLETRLVITKTDRNTFNLFSYSPTNISSVYKISNADPNNLLDEKWWGKLIKIKLTKNRIHFYDDHIKMLGQLTELPFIYQKIKQTPNSPPTACVEAELKYFIISNHKEKQKGLEQYKIIKSLIAAIAATTKDDEIIPELAHIFNQKESIRHRILHRHELVKDIEEYDNTKKAYINAICSQHINPNEKKKEIEESIKTTTPLLALSFLDHEFDKIVLNLSEDQYQKILKNHTVIKKPGISAGLRREYILEDLRQIIDRLIVHKQSFSKKFKSIIDPFLRFFPIRLNIAMSNYLYEEEIPESALIELLSKYLVMESKERIKTTMQILKDLGLINDRIQKKIDLKTAQNK